MGSKSPHRQGMSTKRRTIHRPNERRRNLPSGASEPRTLSLIKFRDPPCSLWLKVRMAQLYVGTSGWAYPTWKPAFYPEKLAQKKFLNFYASKLNAVEVNYTFRQLVKESTVQNWIADTPEHFRFTIKAHQVLTHIKRLKSADEFLMRFMGTLEGLERAGRLGPVLFQLPPNFKIDTVVLAEFLKCLPRTVRAAFEFRNASWFADTT